MILKAACMCKSKSCTVDVTRLRIGIDRGDVYLTREKASIWLINPV